MKTFILTLLHLLICAVGLFSQDLAGKRIYNGSFSLSIDSNKYQYKPSSSSNSNTNVTTNLNFLAGKINAKNAYVAYGFNVSVQSINELAISTKRNSLGPVIQFGKFMKIFDHFYFTPKSNFSVAGVWGKEDGATVLYDKGFTLGVDLTPFSFVYQLKDKIMLNISLGQFVLDYSYLNSSNDFYRQTTQNINLNESISNHTSLGVFYLF